MSVAILMQVVSPVDGILKPSTGDTLIISSRDRAGCNRHGRLQHRL
jgi:hypothetical protein